MSAPMRHHRTLLIFATIAAVWLWHAFGGDPRFDLIGTFGSSVQKLALFAGWIVLSVVAFNTFERGKDLSLGFAIFKAAIVLGGAVVLVN